MSVTEIEAAVYRSKFTGWEERSSVRTKPRRLLAEPAEQGLYFPPEAVPFLDHALVTALEDQRPSSDRSVRDEILMQRLHVYLDFTAELEQRAVNPICATISRRRSGFDFPPGMIQDAHKIYTDEAWHAQFSDDMQRQIVTRSGVQPVLPPTPAFMRRLASAEAGTPDDARGLNPLFFTIVSETLISAILTDIPRDERLDGGVRELVADHAADERVHHAYFVRVLKQVWHQMRPRQRVAVGSHVAEFIRAFLDPDYDAQARILRSVGLDADQSGQVLCDVYDDRVIAADVRANARHTLRHFANVGLLDDPCAVESLQQAGLLDSSGLEG